MAELSSTKDYKKDILKRLHWIDSLENSSTTYPNSTHTTQLIIGANNETDKEILHRIDKIYKNSKLHSAYYSGFTPVEGTEFEKKDSCNIQRVGRLYNADSLLNDYNYKLKELVFEDDDRLSLDIDPKILAASNMNIFPVEINSAPFIDLIRVPGIGVKSAKKIISIRKKYKFTKKEELKRLGIAVNRAEKYIKLDGEYQPSLDIFE